MNLYNRFLLRRQIRGYHRSIDTLPLDSWWKVQETSNFKYLGHKNNLLDDYTLEGQRIYENMFNEYIVLGGLGEEYEKLLELKKKWLLLRCEYLANDDRHVKMQSNLLAIDVKEKEEYLNSMQGMTKEDCLVLISENLGTHIDAKKISVKEFYNYVNYFKKKR